MSFKHKREWEYPEVPPATPQWYRDQLLAEGWKPCPDDETCCYCGRGCQDPTSLCCAHDIEDKMLLPVCSEDGTVDYPFPTTRVMFERLEAMEQHDG